MSTATGRLIDGIPEIPGDLVIDGVRFDAYHYDEGSDILYVHVMDERPRHDGFDETREGHAIMFALDDTAHDAILMGPRHYLARDGRFDLTPRDDGPTETIPRELLESMLIDTPMDDVPDD
jgi:hypothetical protein